MNRNYNPDVLTCLANLSNDEVFTPPQLANQMLDMLPQELFRSPDTKFLDPCTKSGVFLREIAKRLIDGIADNIPDLQARIDHIMHHQLYGLAITELTALMSRRSLYCSKSANSKYSISHFNGADGNVRFERISHTWANGRCQYCSASQEVYDRGEELENHAYQFIHTSNPNELYNNMTFDVIIGNPPYQLEDNGGRESSAIPLYHKFVVQAKRLSPKFLIMIIPARWYTGGKGLDDFRDEMIHDKHICELHDFPETKDCFPNLNIRGGVCYFLWNKDFCGNCKVVNYMKGQKNEAYRFLEEQNSPILIRYNQSISILHKVQAFKEETFQYYVSSRKPFGITSNFDTFTKYKDEKNYIKLYRFGDNGYISIDQVINNNQLIGRYKVLVSKASPGGDEYPHSIVSNPIISEPNSACTETYLVIKVVPSKQQAENLVTYIKTRFFRFMMSLVKNTQNISKKSYMFVPLQDFSKPWTDEELYAKYGLTDDEIAFIESMIRPMD